jgi:hypothetical protein
LGGAIPPFPLIAEGGIPYADFLGQAAGRFSSTGGSCMPGIPPGTGSQ